VKNALGWQRDVARAVKGAVYHERIRSVKSQRARTKRKLRSVLNALVSPVIRQGKVRSRMGTVSTSQEKTEKKLILCCVHASVRGFFIV
jgi:hypothetical protein